MQDQGESASSVQCIYRGREKTRSHFFPMPICYIGVEKKQDLAFSLPLYAMLNKEEKKQDWTFSLPLCIYEGETLWYGTVITNILVMSK